MVSNPTVSKSPHTIARWDFTRNDLSPDEVTTGSSKMAWFRCGNGENHSHLSRISHIASGKIKCPYCSNQKLLPGFNDFATSYPDKVVYWSYIFNKEIPEAINRKSRDKYWFTCESGHDFDISPYMISIGCWCRYCSGNEPWITETLEYTHPEYSEQISPESDVSGIDVSVGSGQKVLWRCAYDPSHEWKSTPYSRIVMGKSCPYCSGRVPIPGVNDLVTTHPELSMQIDPSYGINASELKAGSHKIIGWICKSNADHRWEAYVYNRTHHTNPTGCPWCNPKWSRGEKELLDWIIEVIGDGISVVPNDRTVLGRKEIDIYIPYLKIGFEYNGNYWHKDKGDPDGPSVRKENLAASKGVRLLTIWEDDWMYDRTNTESRIRAALTEPEELEA